MLRIQDTNDRELKPSVVQLKDSTLNTNKEIGIEVLVIVDALTCAARFLTPVNVSSLKGWAGTPESTLNPLMSTGLKNFEKLCLALSTFTLFSEPIKTLAGIMGMIISLLRKDTSWYCDREVDPTGGVNTSDFRLTFAP